MRLKPDISDDLLSKWQKIVDLMATVVRVPAGLIMKVHPTEIEVFVSSDTEGNPYDKGEMAQLNTGLYCETVMARRAELLVPDAREDPEWAHNPDIKLGMFSYFGLPLEWPDGDVFGTICVLDKKKNRYSDTYRELICQFGEALKMDLKNLVTIFELERTQRELQKMVNLMANREVRIAGLKEIILQLRAQPEQTGLTLVTDDSLKNIGKRKR
ncbi:MAG: GAF domain-containing protein [Candidatus Neomarinimicrobiota bacterium]